MKNIRCARAATLGLVVSAALVGESSGQALPAPVGDPNNPPTLGFLSFVTAAVQCYNAAGFSTPSVPQGFTIQVIHSQPGSIGVADPVSGAPAWTTPGGHAVVFCEYNWCHSFLDALGSMGFATHEQLAAKLDKTAAVGVLAHEIQHVLDPPPSPPAGPLTTAAQEAYLGLLLCHELKALHDSMDTLCSVATQAASEHGSGSQAFLAACTIFCASLKHMCAVLDALSSTGVNCAALGVETIGPGDPKPTCPDCGCS